MKEIIKLKFWKLLIAAVVIGILCHMVFGWSVWATALFITFIWFAEKYSRLLYIPAVAIVFWAVFSSYLPITASKSSWGNLKADLFLSKAVDSVQVKADLILEAEKNRQKNNLLDEYAVLLKNGKVEQAKNLMDSIDNLFYPKKVKEEQLAMPTNPSPFPPQASQPQAGIKDSIFTKGVYVIDVKGVTPFNIVVKASHRGCAMYDLSSQKYNYEIVFSDGEVQPGGRGVLKYRENPVFRLESQTGDQVVLKVS